MIMHDILNKKGANNDGEQRIVMVCPYVARLPEDDLLEFRSVTDIAGLVGQHDRNVVLMFPDEHLDLLALWNRNQHLFGMDILSVLDVPGATYEGDYNEATTRSAKVTYHDIIGDIIEAARRKEADAPDPSQIDKERSRISRKTGDIKEIDDEDIES